MRRLFGRLAFTFCGIVLTTADVSAQAVVKITASNYAFVAPDTITAGLTVFDFSNNSAEAHEALLKRVPDGVDLKQALARAQDGVSPDLVPAGGPDLIDAGASARTMQDMKPGRYIWICVVAAPDKMLHSKKGMVRAMVVKAAAHPSAIKEPTAQATIHMTEFHFSINAPAKGAQWLRVVNEGKKPHEFLIIKLEPGKTPADMAAWQRDRQGPAPFKRIGGMAPLAPGDHGLIWFKGDKGDYVFRCRIPDPDLKQTHARMGMELVVKVN